MKYLPITRARMPEIQEVNSLEELAGMETGDLVKVKYLGIPTVRWMVYTGEVDGKPVFIKQSQDCPQDITSYSGDKESLFFQKGCVVIVYDREMEIHKTGEVEHSYKMGLLMAAGLWKNPARIVIGGLERAE